MEHNLKLHADTKLMAQLIAATSQKYNILPIFIEKDYWVTHILKALSISKYIDSAVFKGGTSLSKGYQLISRFSEDVDLAVLHTKEQSGNTIKTIIRNIEKEITPDLREIERIGVTSKGSRFRKSVFEYDSVLNIKSGLSTGSIIVETNSFANPYPYARKSIESFITTFLKDVNQIETIEKYGLEEFSINVLDKRQTLIEKLVSLIRFSHLGKDGLISKIRHFYDIHFLLQDAECSEYIINGHFKIDFYNVLAHDKEMFEDPTGWQDIKLEDISLFNDTERVWSEIAPIYQRELSGLAFTPIPAEGDVLGSFKKLIAVLF
jgi:hypothetical protein